MRSVYVRVLCGGALLVAAVAAHAQARSTWDGVYTEAQAKRGEVIYTDRCATCHAPDLSGMDQAPPLAGDEFLAAWNDLTLHDLCERTRISMPADNPGSLQALALADVLAFVLSKNRFPAGQTDLPSQADSLKPVKFLTKRP